MFPRDQILRRLRGEGRPAWDETLPDGRSAMNIGLPQSIQETLRPSYRGTAQGAHGSDPRVMAKPIGNGQYAERLIGDQGQSIGVDDARRSPSFSPQQVARVRTTLNPTSEAQLPSESMASGTESRPWKVGGSLKTDPLRREAARIRAMIENPASEVSATGAVDAPKPMGRLEASLLGALFGLAQGDQNTPLAGRLAAGAAGAGVGAFKPGAVQDWRRRLGVEDAQGQLAQQTKLSAGQAQLENLRSETQSRMADLMMDPATGQIVRRPKQREPRIVERVDGVYEISEAHPDGRKVGNIPAEVKARGRGSVHYENREDGVYAIYEDADGGIKSQKVEGVPGKPASDTQAAAIAESQEFARATEEARAALKSEIDQHKTQLVDNERALKEKEGIWRKEAQRRWNEVHVQVKKKDKDTGVEFTEDLGEYDQRTLEDFYKQVKAEDPHVQDGTYDETVRNTESIKSAITDKERRVVSMDEDIRKGRAKGARGTARPAQSSGPRWSASKWATANPNGNVEDAKARARARGYQVVE